MWSDEDPDDFLYKKDWCRDRLNSVTPKDGPSDRRYEDIILQCLPPEYDRTRQAHFEREDCSLADIRRMMSIFYFVDNLPARTPIHQEVSRNVALPCRRRGGASAKKNVTTATSSAIIRTTAPTSRQLISRMGDADNGSTSSEADISRISRRRAGSISREKGGKCGVHTTRPSPATTPFAAPGRQTGSTATLTSPKSVLRAFLGSTVRGTSLCEMTPTRSPESHS